MKKMISIAAASLLAGALALSPVVATAAEQGPMVDGVVKEVRPNGDLTIKHGKIPNLDMSAMTMVFKLKDKKLGKGLKVGDQVKIHVEDVGGKLTIMDLKKN